MIVVDLKTLVVAPETRVWRLFPGGDYKFLNAFRQGGVAFLDFPALEFPASLPYKPDAEMLGRMLASDKTRENGVSGPAVTDWKQFRNARRSSARMARVSAIINFYQEARQGDYIIVPSTLQQRRVFVGRLVSNDIGLIKYRYGDNAIPTRSVRWLMDIDESKISAALSKTLRHQHPFSLVEKSRFEEVFALANPSYRFGDRTVATVFNRKDDFLDSDAALMGVISKLAATACAAIEEGTDLGDILGVVVGEPPIEYTCSQESDIHSEGFTRFLSGALTPLVIAAVLALLLSSDINKSPQEVHDDLIKAAITNSLVHNDQCIPPVNEATKLILESVDIGTTYELCKAAHAAKKRAGLEPSATAE